jgi:uncharacterized protein YndB with AHSA1/START domain
MPHRSAEVPSESPLADDALGERVGADALRFVRRFSAPPERVWAAITTPESIAVWLGRPVHIELRTGGRFEVAMSDEDRMDGRVAECTPHRRLAIDWHETSTGGSEPYGTRDGDTSLVSFDLSATEDGGTVLVFTHRYIRGGDTMAGFGAGWHAHLASLGAFVRGEAALDREALYLRFKPAYDERVAEIAKRAHRGRRSAD